MTSTTHFLRHRHARVAGVQRQRRNLVSQFSRAVVLEPAAQAFADANSSPPYLFELGPEQGRAALHEVQSGSISKPDAEITD